MSHFTATSTAVYTAAHAATTAPHENASVRSRGRGVPNSGVTQRRRRTPSIVRRAASSGRVVVSSLSPSVTVDDVADAAAEWLRLDTNPSTRDEIQALLDAGDNSTLADRLLAKRLEFGTAGLRGEMGAGYDRMNNLVVLQTTQGLCDYVQAQLGDDEVKTRGVVIGFDGGEGRVMVIRGIGRSGGGMRRGFPFSTTDSCCHAPCVGTLTRTCLPRAGVFVGVSNCRSFACAVSVYFSRLPFGGGGGGVISCLCASRHGGLRSRGEPFPRVYYCIREWRGNPKLLTLKNVKRSNGGGSAPRAAQLEAVRSHGRKTPLPVATDDKR